jgi:hypothetical protein
MQELVGRPRLGEALLAAEVDRGQAELDARGAAHVGGLAATLFIFDQLAKVKYKINGEPANLNFN